MKRFLLIILLLSLLAACGSNKVKDGRPVSLSGPSLVMFYTDN